MGITKNRLRRISDSQGRLCYLCWEPMTLFVGQRNQLTREHVVPISRGGKSDAANVRAAHRICNLLKGDMTHEEFLIVYPSLESLNVAKHALAEKMEARRRQARMRKEAIRSERKMRRRVIARAILADCF